jgi:predicted ribosomally synthesized peptide with SipW-like signal peptide
VGLGGLVGNQRLTNYYNVISEIFMKQIITSLGTIVFVLALVVGGTGAFFSDTETSTGNVFTAGAIDLRIDNSSYGFDWNRPGENNPAGVWGPNEANSWVLSDLDGELFFNFIDLKPGDYGEDTISIHVDNNDAYACVAFDLTATPENGQNEPEADVDDTAGADEGELQNYLSFLFWHDDGDNVLEVGEELIDGLNGFSGDIFDGGWLPIAESGNEPLPGDSINYIAKGWCFGDIVADPAPIAENPNGPTVGNTGFECTGADGDHNDAQTDGIEVDVSFYAVQARNNDDFSCADLPRLGGEDRRPVGAPLAGDSFVYAAPSSCDFTVPTNYATPDLAVADAGTVVDGSVVCVDTGTYPEFVVDRPLTFVGLNDPSGGSAAVITPGSTSDYGINIGADDVTIRGLKIDGDGTDFTGNHIAGIRVLTDIPDADISGVRIIENVVTDLHHIGASGARTAIGIQLFAEENGLEDILDTDITSNHISNIKSNTGGAHGVQVVNDLVDIVINQNTIEDIDGAWETGVAVDANSTNKPASASGVTIAANNITSSIATFSVQIEAGAKSDEVHVNHNNLATLLYGGSSGDPSGSILDAEDNWWGTATPVAGVAGPDIFLAPGTNVVDFDPAEASAFPLN